MKSDAQDQPWQELYPVLPPPTSAPQSVSVKTPLADAVLELCCRSRQDPDMVSFHALPWSRGAGMRHAGSLWDKYLELFGENLLASDITFSGGVLDSFFRPHGPLDHAQHLAAQAFGAHYTFFVTCGTTVANQVAVDALVRPHERVMVDPTAHQSVHLAANRAASVEYAPAAEVSMATGQPLLDVPRLVGALDEARREGRPFGALLLSGSSYDGVLYDLEALLCACSAASPTTRFLIDEAWSAIYTFHPGLRPSTALGAAKTLSEAGRPVQLLVTHSAHKSMCAARQGSYLHVFGDAELIHTVGSCLYGRHTTSPSIPILSSLDLARAHAERFGHELVDRCVALTDLLREAITHDETLALYSAADFPALDPAQRSYFNADPTTLQIKTGGLGISGDEMRSRLFADYGIYVSRTFPEGFLVKIHIGITEKDVLHLLNALRSMAVRRRRHEGGGLPEVGRSVEGLIIAYPPGVPIAVPGELWTQRHEERVQACREHNIDVYTLPMHDPAPVGAGSCVGGARYERQAP